MKKLLITASLVAGLSLAACSSGQQMNCYNVSEADHAFWQQAQVEVAGFSFRSVSVPRMSAPRISTSMPRFSSPSRSVSVPRITSPSLSSPRTVTVPTVRSTTSSPTLRTVPIPSIKKPYCTTPGPSPSVPVYHFYTGPTYSGPNAAHWMMLYMLLHSGDHYSGNGWGGGYYQPGTNQYYQNAAGQQVCPNT